MVPVPPEAVPTAQMSVALVAATPASWLDSVVLVSGLATMDHAVPS